MDQVTQIREHVDIVSFISEYIPLRKMGRNFKANCPFHNEKTPSFVVSPERQIWHCFGCQKGGDVFSFLMEYEHMEFSEALRVLAKRAGIELEGRGFNSAVSSQKEKLYKLNHLAAEFYHYILTKHNAGKQTLAYLTQTRGINPRIIETFMLGFAPRVGNVLSNYLLTKKKYPKDDVLLSGLSIYKGQRVVDFFSGRLMFPLYDHRGNIVGFSGRVLDEKQAGPKYINTRDTVIYHKGSTLYGLHITKDDIKKKEKAIVVEGEFDVMSCFQYGIANVVAVKGTALTENQVGLLSRFTKKIALCFDEDSAGQDAIKRSLPIIEEKGITTTVIITPDGKDPDESLKKNEGSFKNAVGNDVNIYDFLLLRTLSKYNKKSAEGKQYITEELLPYFLHIENEIVKEHYLRKLSGEIDTSYESILRQTEKLQRKEKEITRPLAQKQKKKERRELLEEYIIALVVQHENILTAITKVKDVLKDFTFSIPAYQKIIEQLFVQESSEVFDMKEFFASLPSELLHMYDTCFLLPLPKFENNEHYIVEIKKTGYELKILDLRDKIKKVGEKMNQKESDEESQELQILQQEFTRLVEALQLLEK